MAAPPPLPAVLRRGGYSVILLVEENAKEKGGGGGDDWLVQFSELLVLFSFGCASWPPDLSMRLREMMVASFVYVGAAELACWSVRARPLGALATRIAAPSSQDKKKAFFI